MRPAQIQESKKKYTLAIDGISNIILQRSMVIGRNNPWGGVLI